ncbi:flagellar motor protein MotB [Myxococcota bacterium]|nr:flagellar motor protein MotB [Myxococcota bacterium]
MRRPSGVEQAQEVLGRQRELDDPWLLSYADLVTNLLAFMVLLVSMASISFDAIDALPGAFSSTRPTAPSLKTISAEVERLAEEEGLTGKVAVAVDSEGLAIQLEDRILFPSGVATLSDEGNGLVRKIAALLRKIPERNVVVEGHTDDVPISTPRFASNWELSAARALEVRKTLSEAGIVEKRLSILAYADTRPAVTDEATSLDERRRRNRRVVIRVY